MVNVDLEEIEKTLKTLWSIYLDVSQMYNVGREPCFSIQEYGDKNKMIDSIRKAVER